MALRDSHAVQPKAEKGKATEVTQASNNDLEIPSITIRPCNDKNVLNLEERYKASVRQFELSSSLKSLDHIEDLLSKFKPGIQAIVQCDGGCFPKLEDTCVRLMKELSDATRYLEEVCYQRKFKAEKHIIEKAFMILKNKLKLKLGRSFYIWQMKSIIEDSHKSVQDSSTSSDDKLEESFEESEKTDSGNDDALISKLDPGYNKTELKVSSNECDTVEVSYAVEELKLIKSLKDENALLQEKVADSNLRLKATLRRREVSDNEEILRLQRRILKLEEVNSSLRLEVFDRTRAAELLCKRLLRRN